MVEEKKLIPKRRFKAFQNADAWEQCELGDILQYEQPTKYIVKTTEYDDKYTTPVLTAGQSFILGYTDESSDIKDANAESPVIIFDDFTTSSQYVDFPFKVKSSAMKLLELKDDSNDFYFAANVLKNIDYIPQGHERHWISKFSKLDVLMPTVEEQRLIGGYFKKLDNIITLHQRKLEKIKSMKKAYLYEMFPAEGENRPKRRFKGFTDDWVQSKLGDLTNIFSAARVHKGEWTSSGVPFFRSSDVVSAYKGNQNEKAFISYELYEKLVGISGKLEKDDILITGGGSIGIPFIVPNNAPLYSKDADLIWIKSTNKFNSRYLFTYFTSPEFRKYLGGISHVGTIAHYTIEQVKETPIRLPSIDEQNEIGSYFTKLDNLITLHQRKLDKLQNLKKAYLNEMFV